KTEGASAALAKNFHRYPTWCRDALNPRLGDKLDSRWFGETGVFSACAIDELRGIVEQTDAASPRIYAIYAYLLSLRLFVEHQARQGREVLFRAMPTGERTIKSSALHPRGRGMVQRSAMIERA